MLLTSIFYAIYDNSFRFSYNFSLFILIILFSLPFSMIIANFYHNQSIGESLFSQRSIYYYFLYFTLHQLKTKPKDLEKIIIILALVYVALYLLQFFLYPREIFNTVIHKDRKTIRIAITGLSYMVVAYFIVLQAFLRHNRLKYLVLYITFLIIIILLGSRFLLLSITSITLFILVVEKKIKSKIAIYLLIALGGVFLYIAFDNIFQEFVFATKETRETGFENIRIKAAKYFLSKFFPTKLSYIFGNGASSAHSELSTRLDFLGIKYGYYLSDIGIIGNYVNYGVIFILGVFGIIYNSLRIKIQSEYNYIKYFFILNALTIITGGGFAQTDFIVTAIITIYMLDVSHHFKNIVEISYSSIGQTKPTESETKMDEFM